LESEILRLPFFFSLFPGSNAWRIAEGKRAEHPKLLPTRMTSGGSTKKSIFLY
jgi:hypothetical protein